MRSPKILVFAGSIRSGSFNARLVGAAVKSLALADVEVTRLSLADYPMPIYDGDLEERDGVPDTAHALAAQFTAHQGIFVASPEYNASLPPLLKNALDWVSRVKKPGAPPLFAYKNRVFALGGASPGTLGGYRGLMALRQMLELGCGAVVIPDQIAVREAHAAFDDAEALRDERTGKTLAAVLDRLVAAARTYA